MHFVGDEKMEIETELNSIQEEILYIKKNIRTIGIALVLLVCVCQCLFLF
jgi:hypothetical protein